MRKAVILFSGGQDSTTCLYWALSQYDAVYPLAIDYGQKHASEIMAAERIVREARVVQDIQAMQPPRVEDGTSAQLAPLKVLPLSSLQELKGSSLTDERQPLDGDGLHDIVNGEKISLPNTFVPGRNALFLTLATAYAASVRANEIVTGVCQTDYSGYPDCRAEFIQAMQAALNLALPTSLRPLTIHTPLMHMTKAESVKLAQSLPGCMDALALSVTCYRGQRPGCGDCAACKLRAKGFAEAGVPDPSGTV